MNGWMLLWTPLWFGGLVLFALLAVTVAIHGWHDLRALLADLTALHGPEEQPGSDAD